MPRSRATTISWAARRAAKYRFQGTVTSTTSQDSATTTAATVSSVAVGTRTTRAAQATRSAAAAPASTRNHQTITRVEFLLMQDSMSPAVVLRIRSITHFPLGTDTSERPRSKAVRRPFQARGGGAGARRAVGQHQDQSAGEESVAQPSLAARQRVRYRAGPGRVPHHAAWPGWRSGQSA